MTQNTRLLTALAVMAMIAGCQSIMAIEPGPYEPNKAYAVNVGKTWTAYPTNTRTKTRVLTIDGTLLNQLVFAAAIKDGESFVATAVGDREKLVPKFRSDMGGFEIAEFVTDSLTALGMVDLTSDGLRPEAFGGLDGIRFEFAGAEASGLEYRGTAKAAVEEGVLHLILFYAPSEYYFDLHKDEVERVLASVSLL